MRICRGGKSEKSHKKRGKGTMEGKRGRLTEINSYYVILLQWRHLVDPGGSWGGGEGSLTSSSLCFARRFNDVDRGGRPWDVDASMNSYSHEKKTTSKIQQFFQDLHPLNTTHLMQMMCRCRSIDNYWDSSRLRECVWLHSDDEWRGRSHGEERRGWRDKRGKSRRTLRGMHFGRRRRG